MNACVSRSTSSQRARIAARPGKAGSGGDRMTQSGGGGSMRRSLVSLAFTFVAALALQGCAAVGITALGVVAGTGAGSGVGHALDSITYKTFSVPLPALSRATVMTL